MTATFNVSQSVIDWIISQVKGNVVLMSSDSKIMPELLAWKEITKDS